MHLLLTSVLCSRRHPPSPPASYQFVVVCLGTKLSLLLWTEVNSGDGGENISLTFKLSSFQLLVVNFPTHQSIPLSSSVFGHIFYRLTLELTNGKRHSVYY